MTEVLSPVQQLMSEHRLIERVLAAFEAQALRLTPSNFNAAFFEKALDFFRNFADGYHHFKEEDGLFPRLFESGFAREAGPVACMLHEHDEGRQYLKGIREALSEAAAGSAEAVASIRQNAAAYVLLLRAHIQKEDNILFPMAERTLSREAMDVVADIFASTRNPRIHPDVRIHFENIAAELVGEAAGAPTTEGG